MLSYRHAFHAGNHADVLKHLVLAEVLGYLCAKDKPLWYVDTHAGAGRYALGRAGGGAEHEGGIARLWTAPALPAPLARYLALVRERNPGGGLRHYPGSPLLAESLLRPTDRIWLFERHPAEFSELHRTMRASRVPARIEDTDGFAGLRSLLPPQPRRAAVMIDPPYEREEEYRFVVEALADAMRRFPTGVYLLWYPQIARAAARRLPARLESLGPRWLHASLAVRAPSGDEPGLFGSGMFVLNPPHTLQAALQDCGPLLAATLGEPGEGRFALQVRG